MQNAIIDFKDVSKKFGKQSALKKLNMAIPEGCIYGLVGRNGAGKSTSLRMIMNMLQPDSGSIQIMGHTPQELPLAMRQQIGYSSDSMPLIPWLKVGQLLQDNGSFYPGWNPEYVTLWLKRLSLDSNKRIFSLSRGERQKLAFLMAIGHRPRLLILDEPAGGLDPVVRQEFLESLIELVNETGTTIVLSSHQLHELERIAEYIGLIEDGQMYLETELESLRARMRRVILMGSEIKPESTIEQTALLDTIRRPGYMELIYSQWDEHKAHQLSQQFPRASMDVQSLNLEEIFIFLQKGGQACIL